MSGKGDSPRPLSVSEEEFGENFDRIDWSAHRTPEVQKAWGSDMLKAEIENGEARNAVLQLSLIHI